MRNLIGLAVALAVGSGAVADVIWDNNIEANGSYARAVSPPEFPGNRAADDFNARPRVLAVWGIHYAGVEDADWEWAGGDGIEVTFYERDRNTGGPGEIFATRTPGGSKTATGETFFGRAAYIYKADFEDDPIKLGRVTY